MLAYCLRTVSYTHLDVYKRQILTLNTKMMSKKIFSAQDWENAPSEILQTHTPDIDPIYNKVKDLSLIHIFFNKFLMRFGIIHTDTDYFITMGAQFRIVITQITCLGSTTTVSYTHLGGVHSRWNSRETG